MALKAAMWVHGNAFHVEGSVEAVTLRSNGALVRGKSDVTARISVAFRIVLGSAASV